MPTDFAYNSTIPIKNSRSVTNGFILTLAKKIGKKLPFTKPTPLISTSLIKEHYPSELDDFTSIDNEKLKCEEFNRRTKIIYLCASFSKCYWQMCFPFLYLAGILSDFIASPDSPNYFLTLTPNELNSSLFGLLLISFLLYTPWLIIEYTPRGFQIVGTQPAFEFNRKTGMITKFEKNNVLYSLPFTHFDCYLMTRYTNKGFPRYSLELFPRYKNTRKSINISSLLSKDFTDIGEYLRLWNMFQCYMDTSQPLPDISVLEKYRKIDPVTAVFDKKTGRKERYWRDMSDGEYTERLTQLDEEQQNAIPLGEPVPLEYAEDVEIE
ncbi:hypothetical protein [Halodesulfovibrio sp.]|uniref:hypothetical protein n=1 Tax=Halodesulfovibrio sp. TaxID=1912772 RepID=UPI0025BA6D4B|nr:hypothetical protein [Halodesulfovibrio sp.]